MYFSRAVNCVVGRIVDYVVDPVAGRVVESRYSHALLDLFVTGLSFIIYHLAVWLNHDIPPRYYIYL